MPPLSQIRCSQIWKKEKGVQTLRMTLNMTLGPLNPFMQSFVKLLVLFDLLCLMIMSVTGQNSNNALTLGSTVNATTKLVSRNKVFELGFISGVQSNQTVHTLAISYAQTTPKKAVWVADRTMALTSVAAAAFSLSLSGDLEVRSNGAVLWTSNTRNLNVVNATMEDTGNLVLRTAANAVAWQSFDSPTDTLLPDQKFATNSNRIIIAWENDGDWRGGNYSLRWVLYDLVARWQIPYPWLEPTADYWTSVKGFSNMFLTRSGELQGTFASTGNVSAIGIASPQVGAVEEYLYRVTLDKNGNFRMYSWLAGTAAWSVVWTPKDLADNCSVSGFCGPYSVCNNGACSCPAGFELVEAGDTRRGCRRSDPMTYCNRSADRPEDTFAPVMSVDWWGHDLPGGPLLNVNLSFCMQQCLASCNCEAVIGTINDTSGNIAFCWHKKDALLNGKSTTARQSYLRVGAGFRAPGSGIVPTFDPSRSFKASSSTSLKIVVAVLGVAAAFLAALACAFGSVLAARRKPTAQKRKLWEKWVAAKGAMVRFTYAEIVIMTEDFKMRIGEGGYGTVFKGQIGGDVTVAVKRLNKVEHVEREFLNEVESVGQIHHVHLVSLLGYCAEGSHRLLVYEYVERGSLDRALFRGEKNHLSTPVLEWRPRFAIAIQTARALAYLHDDCNQRIIHCDVKPENILLDSSLSVKVADFGLSRIMKRDQSRTVTMHIRGTRGYLAPEWTSERLSITDKVDVFSFGMVLLELISGRRNMRAGGKYFPTWAFPMIETSAFLDVVDPALTGIVSPGEVKRALQVAFWCINGNPQARPAMSEVVQMLQGHVAVAVPVLKPDFFDDLNLLDDDVDSDTCSPLHWSSSGTSAVPIGGRGSLPFLGSNSDCNSLL